MIKILFTRRASFGSRLIRWALKEDCSHVAVAFDCDDKGRGIVFHSSVKGVELKPWYDFRKHYEVVHDYEITHISLGAEENVYLSIVERMLDKPYDWKAVIFWSIAVIKARLFGVAIPKKNHWQSNGAYMCTEVLSALKDSLPIMTWPEDLEITSPHEIYWKMRGAE